MAQSIIAGFVLSLLLFLLGFFTLQKGLFGTVGPSDTGLFVALVGLLAGLLGITFCSILWTVSSRLTRIEKALDHQK